MYNLVVNMDHIQELHGQGLTSDGNIWKPISLTHVEYIKGKIWKYHDHTNKTRHSFYSYASASFKQDC